MSLKRNYIITEQIGKGGMATVEKAIQKSLNRFVVIKKIHPHLTDNEENVYRFEREAQSTASLKHVNIMDIIDFGVDGDQYFIVAEYIDGPSLAAVMDSVKQLPLNAALSIMVQMLKGMEHAHNNGVIHRDLKPENIMFTRAGEVKLTDFGVAQAANLPPIASIEKDIVGTPHFMAPEQARGEKIDHRSDLFSAGVILYEMLTGVLPFQGQNKAITLAKLMHEPHAPVVNVRFDVPDRLSRIVDRALEKDATRRFFDATEFSYAVEQCAAESGVSIGPGEIKAFFESVLNLKDETGDAEERTPSEIRRQRPTTTVIKKPRPTAAILPLTGCFGCHVNLLDLHEDFSKLHQMIDVRFSYLQDVKKIPKADIGIVEGSVSNAENEERLKELRESCDALIALGTCACFGGVPGLRNLHPVEEVLRRAYIDSESTADGRIPDGDLAPPLQDHVRAVSDVVTVNAAIPGCPSPPELILESLEHLINGTEIHVPMQSLCAECGRRRREMLNGKRGFISDDIRPIMELDQIDPNVCFLEQGVLCMGISTRSGCGGRCVKNNIPCQGCMGPAPHVKETGAKWINALGSLLPGGPMRFRHDLVGIGYCYTLPVSMMPFKTAREKS